MTTGEPVAIRVERISKQFRLGARSNEFPTLRESIVAGVAGAGRRLTFLTRGGEAALEREVVRALDDVSFEVREGETLGIIGSNGAGKSTLLKVLARVTEPTSGRATVHGRLGSLLEVGTGFHQELTGRENIFLNGAILGMRRAEIRQRFDEIVAFSEVERFIDTAVKFYSSGMYLRLAFAVAAHLEPEILLVDEVLAVGDASFQQKCLGKMGEVARQGRTILFVSHNMVAMEALCDRLVWMRDGRIVQEGATAPVVASYLSTYATALTEQRWTDTATAPGNEVVRMRGARVRPRDGGPRDVIASDAPITIELDYAPRDRYAKLVPSIFLVDSRGTVVFKSTPGDPAPWRDGPAARDVVRDICHVPANLLNSGLYRVAFSLSRGVEELFWLDDVLIFEVRDTAGDRNAFYGDWPGVIRPTLEWHTGTFDEAGQASLRP